MEAIGTYGVYVLFHQESFDSDKRQALYSLLWGIVSHFPQKKAVFFRQLAKIKLVLERRSKALPVIVIISNKEDDVLEALFGKGKWVKGKKLPKIILVRSALFGRGKNGKNVVVKIINNHYDLEIFTVNLSLLNSKGWELIEQISSLEDKMRKET